MENKKKKKKADETAAGSTQKKAEEFSRRICWVLLCSFLLVYMYTGDRNITWINKYGVGYWDLRRSREKDLKKEERFGERNKV